MSELTWDQVVSATSGPLLYTVPLLAITVLFGREVWTAYRGTRSIALSALTTVLTVAAFAIVCARLVALTRA